MPTPTQIDTALAALDEEMALRLAVEHAHASFHVRPSTASASALEVALLAWQKNDQAAHAIPA